MTSLSQGAHKSQGPQLPCRTAQLPPAQETTGFSPPIPDLSFPMSTEQDGAHAASLAGGFESTKAVQTVHAYD